MADLFELGIALKAEGDRELMAALRQIEAAGVKAAEAIREPARLITTEFEAAARQAKAAAATEQAYAEGTARAEKALADEIKNRINALERLGATTNKESLTAVRAYARQAAGLKAWASNVTLTADEQQRLEVALLRADRAANATRSKLEGATRAGVAGLSQIATAGGDAAKGVGGLLSAADGIAWSYGLQGPIVAGVLALGGVLLKVWTDAKEAAARATEDAIKHAQRLTELARTHPGVVARLASGADRRGRSESQIQAELNAVRGTIRESVGGSGDWLAATEREKNLLVELEGAAGDVVSALAAQAVVATEAFTRRTEDSADAVGRQVSNLSTLHDAFAATAGDYRLARALEAQLRAELAGTNVTLERRAQITGQLSTLAGVRAPFGLSAPGVGPLTQAQGFATGGLTPVTTARAPNIRAAVGETVFDAQSEVIRAGEQLRQTIAQELGSGLAAAITGAFESAFSGEGIGAILTNFAASTARLLGQVMISIATKIIAASKLMTEFSAALKSLGAFAGPAGLVIGAALLGLASSWAGGGARGGGGGATAGRFGGGAVPGFGGGGGVPLRYTLPGPSASANMASMERAAVTSPTFVILGRDDRATQDAIFAMWEGARRRGAGTSTLGSYRRGGGA